MLCNLPEDFNPIDWKLHQIIRAICKEIGILCWNFLVEVTEIFYLLGLYL